MVVEPERPQPPAVSVAPPSIVVPDITIGVADNVPSINVSVPSIQMPDEQMDSQGASNGIALSAIPTISVSSESSFASAPSDLPAGAIVCAGCQEAIIGRIVNAMGQRFHPQCFRCNECSELLEHVSSYEWEGKAYCHLDYHDVSSTDDM